MSARRGAVERSEILDGHRSGGYVHLGGSDPLYTGSLPPDPDVLAASRFAFLFLASRYFSVVCLGRAPKSDPKGGLRVLSAPYFTGFAGSAVQGAYQGYPGVRADRFAR